MHIHKESPFGPGFLRATLGCENKNICAMDLVFNDLPPLHAFYRLTGVFFLIVTTLLRLNSARAFLHAPNLNTLYILQIELAIHMCG